MEITVIDTKAKLKLSDDVFAYNYNEGLVHQAVVTYMNNARSGNSAQKTRAEVRGGGRKPWNQKGTGRARSGMSSSPIWRGGGRAFPNSPDENFTQKVREVLPDHIDLKDVDIWFQDEARVVWLSPPPLPPSAEHPDNRCRGFDDQ